MGLIVLLVLRTKARLYILGIDAVRRVRFQSPFNASGWWHDDVRGKMQVDKGVGIEHTRTPATDACCDVTVRGYWKCL